MKKILLISTLLIADFAFASGASFAGGHGHGYFGDHDRRDEAYYRRHDHDGVRHLYLFGWRLPIGWDFDGDDDGRGRHSSNQMPNGPVNSNKFINKGSAPKATIN